MSDKFFESTGKEVGYFKKRRGKMESELERGLKMTMNVKPNSTKKRKTKKKTDAKKDEQKPNNVGVKDEYRKKVLDNGKTMYFRNNTFISEKEYKENVK